MHIDFKELCKYTSKKEVVEENEKYFCLMAEKEINRGVKKVYAAVIGELDDVVLITYDEHFEKNALNRIYTYADDVVESIIKYLEYNDALSDNILNAENIAYEKNKSHGTAAVHFQKDDWFLYLSVKNGIVHISTLVSQKIYYVNPDSELVVAVDENNKKLFFGIENNNRFEVSKGLKYKGGNGH